MYLLERQAHIFQKKSKKQYIPGHTAVLRWHDDVEYIGGPCSSPLGGGHSNMPPLRRGPLIATISGRAYPDVLFCENGTFEVAFKKSLAEKVGENFPGLEFAQATIYTRKGDLVDEYVEVVRPPILGLNMKASGYQLGKVCEVCGFVEHSVKSSPNYVIDFIKPPAHFGVAWQNSFITFVSEELGEFLLENAEGCFLLVDPMSR